MCHSHQTDRQPDSDKVNQNIHPGFFNHFVVDILQQNKSKWSLGLQMAKKSFTYTKPILNGREVLQPKQQSIILCQINLVGRLKEFAYGRVPI